MSKTQKIAKLSPSEEAVAKRILLGKEKIYKFKNAEDAIKSLHAARRKASRPKHPQ